MNSLRRIDQGGGVALLNVIRISSLRLKKRRMKRRRVMRKKN
jgi:hypothetical protein